MVNLIRKEHVQNARNHAHDYILIMNTRSQIIGSPKIGLESFILMIEHILVSIFFDLTRATLLSLRNTLTLL